MSNISELKFVVKKWRFILLLFLTTFYFSLCNAQTIDSNDLDNSINKAVGFFDQRISSDQLYYLVVPVLIPIAEYYKISLNNKVYTCGNYITNDQEKKIFLLYSSFFDFKCRGKHYQLLYEKPHGIDGVNLFSLYGPKALSKKSFYSIFDSCLQNQSYELTHAYLASLILRNTKYVSKGKCSNLELLAWSKMREVLPAAEDSFYTDLEIEAIAFTLYGGQIDSIKPQHISNLIKAQNSNGSWDSYGSTSPLLRDHTTVLALWALLEWKYMKDLQLFLPRN